MKRTTIIASLLITTSFTTNVVFAKAATTEENIGFFSGAIAGAAIGGPLGFVVGGITGALTGEQVNKANQFDQVNEELTSQKLKNNSLQQAITQLQHTQQIDSNITTNNIENDWLTEGLSLNLLFTTNSSQLSINDQSTIKRLSFVLNKYPEMNIQLDGYTDPRGSDSANLTLSQQRLESVKKAFSINGISSNRLRLNAHGETKFSEQEINLDSYARERRVSINLIASQEESVAQN